ncbi:MAG: chemotaxis protein methyltransferase CheR [Marinobacter excellens HL-55]|uniref:Chemotaxis protein methyltransferase n=1 Tax=Marinobacter excellens HL-55 TaxID=1305731 RepID=A0A0P8B4D3_9GAMM|nr:MAG: chemotaxis protein methyltransferase CheR [Marinobacter excellens HL-55]
MNLNVTIKKSGMSASDESAIEGFMRFFEAESGISLSRNKQYLVAQRLESRLRATKKKNYADYLAWVQLAGNEPEKRLVVDLLTTNETSFFREVDHFKLMAKLAKEYRDAGKVLRIWSAACSSGEEPYSIAMVLDQYSGNNFWEIDASDLSESMLDIARQGLYPLRASDRVPQRYLKQYCLRGRGAYQDQFMIKESLRKRVYFCNRNLMSDVDCDKIYDAIFLRNVLIYFDANKKKRILQKVIERLAIGGRLIIGHAESVLGLIDGLEQVQPSVYIKAK